MIYNNYSFIVLKSMPIYIHSFRGKLEYLYLHLEADGLLNNPFQRYNA